MRFLTQDYRIRIGLEQGLSDQFLGFVVSHGDQVSGTFLLDLGVHQRPESRGDHLGGHPLEQLEDFICVHSLRLRESMGTVPSSPPTTPLWVPTNGNVGRTIARTPHIDHDADQFS